MRVNQKDIPERNEQAPRMGRIYKSAHLVVVWLGEASEKSRLASSIMTYLESQVEFSFDWFFGQVQKLNSLTGT